MSCHGHVEARIVSQEPGSNAEVKARVDGARNSFFILVLCGACGFWKAFAQSKCPDTFPLFAKIDVNGDNEA